MLKINFKKLIFLFLISACVAGVLGCVRREAAKPVVNNNINQINQNINTNTADEPIENGGGEIDTSDWLTYRNEEYGFEVKYPEEWNIFNKSAFSKYDQERGKLELGFTYDEIVEGVRPMRNMASTVIVVYNHKEGYFENLKEECLKQKTCGDDCRAGETCYNLQEILIDNREAIKYNYIGIGYSGPEWTLSAVRLNNDKILYIRYINKTDIKEHFSEDIKTRLEKEMRDVKKILSTVKIW